MRKKILLVSLASLMSVSTLAVAIFASKDKDVFKGADKEALGSGVFVVDEESIEVDSDDTTIYHAIAVSDSGYTFNTKFVGFSLDGEGQLYLPKGSVGYFTNVDGLSLGFSDLNVSFTSSSDKVASYYGSYFSFYSLELSSIINGTCDADLKVDFGPFDNPSNLSYSASNFFSLSQMANSRYALFAIQDIETDLYVSNVSFSTPCNYEEPAEGDEPTPYSSYKKSEKQALDQFVPEFPFVGNGSYKFYYDEEGRTISIGGITQGYSMLMALSTYLENNEFNYAGTMYGYSYYQKVITTEPEYAITFGIAMNQSYELMPYELGITDQYPIIEIETGWPKSKIEEKFSSEFATIINQYEIKDIKVNYQVHPDYDSDLSQKTLSMSLTFPDLEHDGIIDYFITYMAQISSDYPNYVLNTHTDTDYYNVYTISLINNVNNTSIHFADVDYGESHGYTMSFAELITYDEYPLEQIAEYAGVSVSSLGTYVSGGNSWYSFESYNKVAVHNDSSEAALSEVLAYKDNLINNYGYTLLHGEKGYYELRSDPFDGVQIEIDTNRMSITTNSSTYVTYDDMQTAIENGGFNERVQNHEFPELSELEHRYMILEGDNRGIYISNCIEADVTALTSGGVYDPLSDSYLFDLSDGYYLGIKATLNSRGNIVLNFVNVSKDVLDNLMTSSEINEHFEYNTSFFPLDDTGDEKLYLLNGDTIVFLDESVYQSYLAKLEANDYEYSSFKNVYYNSETQSTAGLGSETYYGHELLSVQFWSQSEAPLDFVDYEEADLENIESVFDIAFPQTAKSYIHVPERDYIICKSRIESLEQQLIANGYTKDESGNAVSFEKADGRDHYRVTGWYDNGIYPYDFDESTGYVMYGFEYIPDAYLTYPEFASKVSSECLDETLVDAVIEFSDMANAYIEVPKYGIDLSSVSFYTLDSYISLETIRSAFEEKGYEKPDEHSDTYYIYEDNYYIRASINQNSSYDTNVQFKITRFNWISSLDDIENRLFYFAFQQNEYIARLDTTDAVYSVARSDSSELYLDIKIDSLDDYYDALEDLGYNVEKSEKESSETRCWINLENGTIECSIRLIYSNIYEVNYSCYSSSGSLSVSLIDRYLQKQGLTGAQLCNDENVTFRCYDSDTSEYYNERTITFFSDDFEYIFPLGEYEYDSENDIYKKEDENCTYSIKLDGNYVTIVVDKK